MLNKQKRLLLLCILLYGRTGTRTWACSTSSWGRCGGWRWPLLRPPPSRSALYQRRPGRSRYAPPATASPLFRQSFSTQALEQIKRGNSWWGDQGEGRRLSSDRENSCYMAGGGGCDSPIFFLADLCLDLFVLISLWENIHFVEMLMKLIIKNQSRKNLEKSWDV